MTDGFKNPIICFAKCGSTGGKNDRFCSWVKDLMRCSVCLYLKTYIQNWANLFAFKIATKTQATWPKLNNSTNFMLLGFTFLEFQAGNLTPTTWFNKKNVQNVPWRPKKKSAVVWSKKKSSIDYTSWIFIQNILLGSRWPELFELLIWAAHCVFGRSCFFVMYDNDE